MRYYWLVELRPAFEGHPPFPATYYAGYYVHGAPQQTEDVFAAPRWTRQEDAERVANQCGFTLSCIWQAVEHGFEEAP